jgi:hypothetical protein
MAKLLHQHQLPQDHAENDKASITSYVHVEHVQVFGQFHLQNHCVVLLDNRERNLLWAANSEEDVTCQSSHVAASGAQIDQESNAMVR